MSASEVFEAQTYSNFFRFPIIFLCGLFLPISELPVLLRPLFYAIPVTYGVDLIRYAATGSSLVLVVPGMDLLFLFCAVLFGVSIRNIRRKWIL